MANVYTKLLWNLGDEGPGEFGPVTVPDGHVWVIRDVVAHCDAGAQALNGMYLHVAPEAIFFQVSPAEAWGGQLYRSELRTVVNPLQQLYAEVFDARWYWRVSGYDLLLP